MADGVEIATAYVSLVPSFQGAQGRIRSELEGTTNAAADRAGRSSGQRFGSRFTSAVRSPISKLGAVVAGAFAVDKVKDFLAGSIDEARESQKVSAQTAQVIRSTGGAAGVSANQVGKLAGAISNYAGIDDEVIQGGANMLLTFKNIRNAAGKGNDVFNQATKILTDMSVAMGTEPQQAAIQLGKALNDPVKGISALSRVGVTFDAQQTKTIKNLVKSGNTMKAQKIILRELGSEFGGSAKAQATAGDKMSVAWGNLKEQIGTALLPTLDRAEKAISGKVIPTVSKFLTEMQNGTGKGGKFVDFVKDLGSAVEHDVLPMLHTLATDGKAVASFFMSLPKPVRESTVALGLLGGAALKVVPAVSNMVGGFRNAETGALQMTKRARLLAGAGGLLMLGTSFQTAKRDGASFSSVLTGTVGGAMTGLAVGGPIGALVGGVAGGGLTALAGAFSRSETAARNQKYELSKTKAISDATTYYGQLRDTLNQVTGAYTGSSRAAVAKSLWDDNGKLKDWASNINGAGVSLRTLTSALMGSPTAITKVNKAIGGMGDTAAAVTQTGFDEFRQATGRAIENTRDLADTYVPLNKRLGITKKTLATFPKDVRLRIKSDVPDTYADIQALAFTTKDLSRQQIRILLKAANIAPTKKAIQGIIDTMHAGSDTGKKLGRDLRKVGSQHPSNTWLQNYSGQLGQARTSTGKQSRAMGDILSNSTSKSKPNLHPFLNSLSSALWGARKTASSEGKGVGSAIGAGLNTGVNGWVSTVAQTARNLVSAAIKAAHDEADSHSPSRKMIRLGNYMGDGVSIGMDQRQDRVQSSARDLIGRAVTSASKIPVSAALAASVAPSAAAGGALPSSLRLVVDGYEFSAYVEGKADDRVAAAAAMSDQMDRAVYS